MDTTPFTHPQVADTPVSVPDLDCRARFSETAQQAPQTTTAPSCPEAVFLAPRQSPTQDEAPASTDSFELVFQEPEC